jgi:hypothetical protein
MTPELVSWVACEAADRAFQRRSQQLLEKRIRRDPPYARLKGRGAVQGSSQSFPFEAICDVVIRSFPSPTRTMSGDPRSSSRGVTT